MEIIKEYVYTAARDGKIQSLKILFYLKSKSEISELISACQNGTTPLMIACRNGHLEVVHYLIEKCHAEVEEVGKYVTEDNNMEGVTPLWSAAAAGQLSIVEALIKYNASVNTTTSTKSTPLRAACYGGHFEVVKYLIRNGADVNIENCKGQTCLMVACYKGHYQISDFLIKCGAKVNALDMYGNSALKIFVKSGNIEMAKKLIELGANVSISGCYEELSQLIYSYPNGSTSLLQACLHGNLEIVEYLIQKCHANIEEIGSVIIENDKIEGVFPLWCASFAGHLNIVEFLIEHHAFVNKATKTNSTALRAACNGDHLKTVKYLIKNGADINFPNIYGGTCLQVALYLGHNEISKYLIECGANVNIVDSFGDSILKQCVLKKNLEMLKYLLNHEANIEVSDSDGETCLILACRKEYYEIAKYLMECGANVNRKTLRGYTALHNCTHSNNLEMVQILFQKGAKMYVDIFGTTPLLSAAVSGYETIVDFFINNYEVNKEDMIHAFELLGTYHVNNTEDVNTAVLFWEKAMTLRYEKNKIPIRKYFVSSLASYLDTTEVNTINDLRNLNTADHIELRKQSLLVRERILGDSHPHTIHSIRLCGADYGENGDYEKGIQLLIYAVEMLQQSQNPLHNTTVHMFDQLIFIFFALIEDLQTGILKLSVSALFQSMLCVLQRIVREITRACKEYKSEDLKNSEPYFSILYFAMCDVELFCKLLPNLNQFEKIELKKAVSQIIHLNPITFKGLTFLHLPFVQHYKIIEKIPEFPFPSVEIIDLLLEVGACPNAMDDEHNTPLHLAASIRPLPIKMITLFLDSGAHLDYRNFDNLTPLQLIYKTVSPNIYPLKYLNLQCLCAQAINTYKIPYKDIVPSTVCEFINRH